MIKDRLVVLRKEKHLKQPDIAEYLQCSVSTVSGYENGKPLPVDVILKLADYYDVSTDYLLCRTNERQKTKGDLRVILDRLSRFLEIPFLTGMDIAELANSIYRYKQGGASIGNYPIDAVRNYVIGMTQVFNAMADGNVPMLIEGCNNSLISGLESAKFYPAYIQYSNQPRDNLLNDS